MIFHPPVLALVLIALIGAAMIVWSAVFALRLIWRWDLASGSEAQIVLEKRSYLVSTLIAFVMAMQAAALLLFVFNADRMAAMFVGAMCAVGTLNASVYGFPALYAKITLFFGAALWLILHVADRRGHDYPLIRHKYGLLLALAPIALADASLTLAYFLDLRADTLTSCCGSVFSAAKDGLGGDMAALDPRLALTFLAGAFMVSAGCGLAVGRNRLVGVAFAVTSLLFFAVAMAAVVSAISLYVYEHPHHHCPFCLLKREYGYFGFALYTPLFVGTALGMGAGVLSSLTPPKSLATELPMLSRSLARWAIGGFALFCALATYAVMRSGLILMA